VAQGGYDDKAPYYLCILYGVHVLCNIIGIRRGECEMVLSASLLFIQYNHFAVMP